MKIQLPVLKDGILSMEEREITPEDLVQLFYPYLSSRLDELSKADQKRYRAEVMRLLFQERQRYQQ